MGQNLTSGIGCICKNSSFYFLLALFYDSATPLLKVSFLITAFKTFLIT